MNDRYRLATAIGLAAIAILASPQPAEACLCFPQACGSILEANAVFEATVVAIEKPATPDGNFIVRLADVRAVRGGVTPEFIIGGAGASCAYHFKEGVRYLIDAHEFEPGRFGASLCSNTRPLSGARGLLDYLSAPTPAARPRVWGTLTSLVADRRVETSRGGGPPVSGATITLSGPVERRTTTTASGGFTFVSIPDGTYQLAIDVPADRPDVANPPAQTFTLDRTTACASFDVLAPSIARVSGVVRTERGAPASGVRVEIFPLPFDQWAGGYVTAAITDANGRYSIERIAPGVYGGGVGFPYPNESTPYTPVRAQTSEGATDIVVTPGADVQLPPILVRPAPLVRVSGQVTGSLDRVGDLTLVLSALDAFPSARLYGGKPDAAGRFTLSVHRGVRYLVRLEGAGRLGTTEFVAGDETIEVLLRPRR